MITDIALLLATLSIMTGALVITGVPTKLGALLVEAAGINMAAMVAMAFLFGVILGTGLPPGAGLHPGRDRDRAAIHAGRRQSMGGAFLRVLCRRVRRADAADIDHRGDHVEDRQRVVLRDALAIGADLRFAVHADGGRVCSSRAGHRAGP